VLRWLVGSGDEREAELVVGCLAAAAGEIPPASWRLEQTNKRAQELQGGSYEVASSTCWRGKASGGGVHCEASMADGGGSAPARGRTGRLYSRAQGGEGCFLACQGNQVKVWVAARPEYGANGRRRRAACTPARGWLGGAAVTTRPGKYRTIA
jgi:hypothetical protein